MYEYTHADCLYVLLYGWCMIGMYMYAPIACVCMHECSCIDGSHVSEVHAVAMHACRGMYIFDRAKKPSAFARSSHVHVRWSALGLSPATDRCCLRRPSAWAKATHGLPSLDSSCGRLYERVTPLRWCTPRTGVACPRRRATRTSRPQAHRGHGNSVWAFKQR